MNRSMKYTEFGFYDIGIQANLKPLFPNLVKINIFDMHELQMSEQIFLNMLNMFAIGINS